MYLAEHAGILFTTRSTDLPLDGGYLPYHEMAQQSIVLLPDSSHDSFTGSYILPTMT